MEFEGEGGTRVEVRIATVSVLVQGPTSCTVDNGWFTLVTFVNLKTSVSAVKSYLSKCIDLSCEGLG